MWSRGWIKQGLVGLTIAGSMGLAAGCASGTFGRLGTTDELPQELSPELQQKFEIMERTDAAPHLPDHVVDPVPESLKPAAQSRLADKKSAKRGKKGLKGAPEPQPSAAPAASGPIEYPNRRPPREPIWIGEKMVLDVSYFAVSAGQFTLEALPRKSIAGREVYHIRGVATTSQVFNLFYRLNDTVESFIDFQGFFSHRFHIVLDETKQARDALELNDHEKAQTFYWNRWNHKERGYTETKEFAPIPRFAQDSMSVLYYLRAVPLPPGAVVTVPVISEGKSWEAVVTVMRREKRSTPMGEVMTVVLKPETRYQGVLKKQGDSFLWLTDDDRRIPVRLEAKVKIGTVVANLREFEPGRAP
jgi:hypothetical protein